jgi:flagellar motor switch protein FliN/FliY
MNVPDGFGNFDLLMRVPLHVTAELGGCKMTIEEVLRLGTGSILDLHRPAGGPIDLLVNDKVVARGDIVAVGENFGVRITELVTQR